MQRVTPDIRDSFGSVEQALKEAFITSLFHGLGEGTLGREVTRLPAKQAGLALPDPKKTAPENWTDSCVITGHFVAALRGQEDFRTADKSAYLREGRAEVQKRRFLQAEEVL